TSALTQRRSVDLPAPEGPMRQITSPFMTSKVTPPRTTVGPNDLCTSRMRISGWSGVQEVVEVEDAMGDAVVSGPGSAARAQWSSARWDNNRRRTRATGRDTS